MRNLHCYLLAALVAILPACDVEPEATYERKGEPSACVYDVELDWTTDVGDTAEICLMKAATCMDNLRAVHEKCVAQPVLCMNRYETCSTRFRDCLKESFAL